MFKKTVFLMSIAFCCMLAVAIGLCLPTANAGVVNAASGGGSVSVYINSFTVDFTCTVTYGATSQEKNTNTYSTSGYISTGEFGEYYGGYVNLQFSENIKLVSCEEKITFDSGLIEGSYNITVSGNYVSIEVDSVDGMPNNRTFYISLVNIACPKCDGLGTWEEAYDDNFSFNPADESIAVPCEPDPGDMITMTCSYCNATGSVAAPVATPSSGWNYFGFDSNYYYVVSPYGGFGSSWESEFASEPAFTSTYLYAFSGKPSLCSTPTYSMSYFYYMSSTTSCSSCSSFSSKYLMLHCAGASYTAKVQSHDLYNPNPVPIRVLCCGANSTGYIDIPAYTTASVPVFGLKSNNAYYRVILFFAPYDYVFSKSSSDGSFSCSDYLPYGYVMSTRVNMVSDTLSATLPYFKEDLSVDIEVYSPYNGFRAFDEKIAEDGIRLDYTTDTITSTIVNSIKSAIQSQYLSYYKGISLSDSEDLLSIPHTITEADIDDTGNYTFRVRFDFPDCPYCDEGCDRCNSYGVLIPQDVTFVLMDNSTQVTKSLTEITQDVCDFVWAEWKEAYPDLDLTDKYWLLIQKDGTSYGSTLPFTVDSADYVVVMESLFPVTFEFPDGSTKVDRLDYITQSVIDNMWSEWSTSNNYSWGYSRVLTYDGQVSDSVTLEYPLAVLYKDLHIVFIPYSYKVTFDLNLPEGVTGYAVGEIAENGDYNDASVMYEAASAVAYGSLVDSTTVLNCASVVGIGCYKDWATLSENYIFLGWALSPTARADDVVIPASFFKEQLIEGTSYINLVPDTSKDGGVVYITQETTFYAVYSSLHIRIYSPSDYFSVFDESKVEGGTCYNCITDDITSDVEAFVLSLILPKYLTYYKGISLFDSEEILTIPHTITEEDLDSNGCYSYRLRFDFVDCPYCDDGCDYCYNCSFLVPWDVTFSFTDNSTQIVKRLTEVTQEVCDSVWAEWREAYPDLSSTEKYWLLIDQNATSDGIASPIKVDAPGFLVIMFSFSPVAFEFPDGSTKVDRLDYITQSVIDDMWSEWSTANNYSWGYSRILAYDGQVSDSVTLEYPLAVLYTDLHIVFSPHSYKVTFDLNLPEGSTGYAVGEVAENGDYNDTSVMYEAASAVSYGSYLNTTSVLNCVPVVGIGCYSNWPFLSFCYAFLGWGTSPTAGADDVVIPASFFEAQEMEGTSYVNLIPVTSEVGGYIYITQDTTFYAVYSIFEISITYESNGGDLSGDYTTTLVAVQPLLLPAVTKEDYDFKGWYYDPACTIPYKEESGINLLYVTEDYTLTLYAAYKEKSIFSDILTFIKQVCIVAVIAIVAYVVLAVFSSGHKKS